MGAVLKMSGIFLILTTKGNLYEGDNGREVFRIEKRSGKSRGVGLLLHEVVFFLNYFCRVGEVGRLHFTLREEGDQGKAGKLDGKWEHKGRRSCEVTQRPVNLSFFFQQWTRYYNIHAG